MATFPRPVDTAEATARASRIRLVAMDVDGTLTEALPRDLQWELGVLRPLTTTSTAKPRQHDPELARLTKNGKPRKEIWVEEGYERLGYDDLVNVVKKIRDDLDYGRGAAPDLHDDERLRRRRRLLKCRPLQDRPCRPPHPSRLHQWRPAARPVPPAACCRSSSACW